MEAPCLHTFEDVCDLLKVSKAAKWKPGTFRFFDGHADGTLKPAFGERLITSITTFELQQFLDAQLQRTATRGARAGEAVSTGTVQKYAKVLSEVFRYAVRMGFVKASPMANVIELKAVGR